MGQLAGRQSRQRYLGLSVAAHAPVQRFFCSVILIDHHDTDKLFIAPRPCSRDPPLSSPSATGKMMATNTSSQPVCQNCTTSTTPLWRRDEFGSVLCNACGLFLKLHGRPRPISLKTDVIKSRNRVKTIRPDLASKKKVRQSSPFPQPWMCDTRVTCANITIAAATTATATGTSPYRATPYKRC